MKPSLKKHICESIRSARLARKLTHEQLAKRTGISIATIQRIESAGPVKTKDFFHVLSVLNPKAVARIVDAMKFNSDD